MEFVGVSAISTHSDVSASIAKPSGVADGDFLVRVGFLTSGFNSLADPAGWTRRRRDTYFGAGGEQTIWTRIASSEPSTYALSGPASLEHVAHIVLAYRGATEDPVASGTTGATPPSGPAPATAPSISGAVGGLLVCAWGWTNSGSSVSYPAGMTGRAFVNAATDANLAVADILDRPSGTTGDKIAVEVGGFGEGWVGQQLVTPASGGGGLSMLV